MRDEDERLAVAADGRLEQGDDLPAVSGVQIAGGLVGQDEGGLMDERPADGDALLLPA